MANRFRRSGTSARRLTEWIALTVNYGDFTAGQIKRMGVFTEASLSLFVPFTIVRTVGILSVAVDNDPIL
ncbi:hypothetical protein, partial [Pseudomonas aeruginosa]|uniref:hypothetical protein n=1 Tax=Pseudomonas aeruginosa TaxID=287 RepID=UPI001CA57BDB